MTYKIEIKKVDPLIIAAVREVIPYSGPCIKIPLLLNKVYEFFKSSGIVVNSEWSIVNSELLKLNKTQQTQQPAAADSRLNTLKRLSPSQYFYQV